MKKLNAGIMLLAAVLSVLVVLRVRDARHKEAAQEERLKAAQQKAIEEEFVKVMGEELLKLEAAQRDLLTQAVAYLPAAIPSERRAIQNRLAGLPKGLRDAVGTRGDRYLADLDGLVPKAAELMKRGATLPSDSKELDALDQEITALVADVERPRLELERLLATPGGPPQK